MTNENLILNALLRENLNCFVHKAFNELHPGTEFISTWHVQGMCFWLGQVIAGNINRLLITVPPRHLKSICTSVALPAFILGHDPSKKMIVASYGADLAEKHSQDFKSVVQSQWFRNIFPGAANNPIRNTKSEYTTAGHGTRLSVSLGGSVTGFGADILIIDDLMKAQDARSDVERERGKRYYEETLYSRLNDKANGIIIVIQQRLHEDDLPGFLLDKGGFTHLNLPSIADEDQRIQIGQNQFHERKAGDVLFPEVEPKQVLDTMRVAMGNYAFSAQYLQNPTPIDGARIQWDAVPTYSHEPNPADYQQVVQSWDTGMTAERTSDFSVCLTWGFREGLWDLINVYRARLDYTDLKSKVKSMRTQFSAGTVIMENASTGKLLIREFINERLPPLKGYTPRGDKIARFEAQMAKMTSGRYRIANNASYLTDFKREVSAFPNGRNDDQVDALSQFLHWSGSPSGLSVTRIDPVTGRRRRRSVTRRRSHRR